MADAAVLGFDWGTTSCRAWAIGRSGAGLARVGDLPGMSRIGPADYPGIVAQAAANFGLEAAVPVLICGMAGARGGWQEAGYCDVPCGAGDVIGGAVGVADQDRDVRILPGIAQRAAGRWDVMRGEETLLLGAMAAGETAMICLPGTHSKWVRLEAGRVAGFATAMTGEAFAALSAMPTLAPFTADDTANEAAFLAGVRDAIEAPEALLVKLFRLRAQALLQGDAAPGEVRARLSGLLIGQEIAGLGEAAGAGVVRLLSGGALGALYAKALGCAGVRFETHDADAAAVAGLARAARGIWPDRFDEGDTP